MSWLQDDTAKAPILVLAVGNPSRGDDAFGPLLAQRLSTWLDEVPNPDLHTQVEVICDQQLVVEHVLDLQGRQRVLFIDAAAQGDAPLALTTVAALSAPPAVTSHACTPAQLLALHQAMLHAEPPPADLLTVVGQGFELGHPLSASAEQGLQNAWPLLQAWLNQSGDAAHA